METHVVDGQKLMQLWLDYAAKMLPPGATVWPESASSEGAKQIRDIYLSTLSQQTEQFMRSPQFLEMMKQSTDSAVALRQQTNDLLAQIHHAMGSLAQPDVDSLLMAVRRCETRVLDKLDELSARINDLESRRGVVQSDKQKAGRKSPMKAVNRKG